MKHQWKYKQKTIEDLQKYIHNVKEKENVEKQTASPVNNEYSGLFKHINFASRLEEEEKKMEEFEKFMDEIHDFLETDTTTENESAFKWGIHSYIDMIEGSQEEKTDIAVKYERKLTEKEKVPKLSDIKAKLERRPSLLRTDTNDREIGKLNVASFLSNTEESPGLNSEATNSSVGSENVSKTKSLFEATERTEAEWEKTVVRRKLIEPAMGQLRDDSLPIQNKKVHDWKYKKKDLQELQSFISKNKDIASSTLLKANQKMIDQGDDLSSRKILDDSTALVSRIVDRDAEFESFMSELKDYMNESSACSEQQDVKDNIRQYLELIGPHQSPHNRASEMPEIGSARKIRDIKQSLSSSNEKSSSKTVNTDLIGKVTHFFKKNTNQKMESSNVVKENISSLLEPGKARLMKMSLESKPKLARCSSAIELPVTKLPKKNLLSFTRKDPEAGGPSLASLKSRKEEKPRRLFSEARKPEVAQPGRQEKAKAPTYKSPWESIEDPEEKRKAILAKYGLKTDRNRQDDQDDMEEILNYENKDDMKEYERELHKRYFLCDSSDNSSRDSSPEPAQTKTGSHSSLLSILNVMKKAANTKSFSDSKAKVLDFGKSCPSKSEVDLSEISRSCSDVRNRFENYQAQPSQARKQSLFDEEEEKSMLDISNKKARWENAASSSSYTSASNEELMQIQSISRIKDQLSSNRNGGGGGGGGEDGQLSLQEELEELRQSSKLKNMFRLEKGRGEAGAGPGLRRTNSCIGVTGERLPEDLDEDTLAEVSLSNKMVKAMFEENAPKYKFGGSGSQVNLSSSKENVGKNVVTRPSVKPKEERKWVLDTINKYFEVIVEEEDEEEGEEGEEYSDTDSEYSEYEDDDYEEEEEEQEDQLTSNPSDNFQSTSKMRGILSSVVSKISGSVGNLAKQDLMQNLKQNLGSQITLRASNNNLPNN